MALCPNFDVTVTSVAAANRFRNAPTAAPIRRERRERWAVVLKYTGRTFYTANGRQSPSDCLHPVILPKGCTYSWQCVEEGECMIIEFEALQEWEELLSFSVSDSSFFVNTFFKVEKCLRESTPESRMEARHLVSGILLQLIRSAAKEYAPRKKQLLEPAITCLTENYADPAITNDTLAALCGISTVYFRKSFETVYGQSPIRWLHSYRIQKAKDILSSDYGSIALVAQSVGYSNVYHFSKMFKTYTGMSPTQFVKEVRK